MAESSAPLTGGKLIAVALVFAGVAALINLLYVNWVRQQTEIASISVCVLDRPVKRGQKLNERDYKKVQIPNTFEDAVFGKTGLHAIKADNVITMALEGKVYERSAGRNTIISYQLFTQPDEERNDDRIEDGMVLVSLPIDGKNQPGNLLPGMSVDIAAPFLRNGTIPEVLPVMEKVDVFAMDRYTAEEENTPDGSRRTTSARVGNFRAITIMVKPEIARNLLMIENVAAGEFHLLVRKPGDLTKPTVPPDQINPQVLDLLQKRLGK